MSEGMNEGINEGINKRINKKLNEGINERINERINKSFSDTLTVCHLIGLGRVKKKNTETKKKHIEPLSWVKLFLKIDEKM